MNKRCDFLSRRNFIAGAAAFGGLAAFRVKAGTYSTGTPNLRVGIVSDMHVRYEPLNNRMCPYSDAETAKHAFEYFRDQQVDAVVVAGDFTDYGQIREMQEVANKWFEVFPDNKGLNGQTVEKIFVFGNHEWDIFTTDMEFARERYGGSTPEECLANVMRSDPAKHWKDIWGEEFSRVYMKDVKGYKFIAAHWMDDGSNVSNAVRYQPTADFVAAHRAEIPTDKPFFYVQHPHPQGTVFPGTIFHDNGATTAAFKGFNNLIAITGHSHYSVTDLRSVWQGDYTAVNTGCLRWTIPTYDIDNKTGYMNSSSYYNSAAQDPQKTMTQAWADWTSRLGLMMEVYDDYVVIKRRDFYQDLPIDDDWVIPTTPNAPKPYAPDTLKAATPAPQFPAGAALTVTRGKGKNRKDEEKDVYKVLIPQANAVAGGRVYNYDVEAVTESGVVSLLPVLDIGFNHSLQNAAKQVPVTYQVPVEDLPQTGAFQFRVTPKGWFGQKGQPLVSGAIGTQMSASMKSVASFVFLNPDASSFWRTAESSRINLPIEFPKGATSATLQVTGINYSQVYSNITASEFVLDLPAATAMETENVYDLTLTFDTEVVRKAKIGFIHGLETSDTAGTRCLTPQVGHNYWNKIKDGRAVLPIPQGTTSFTLNGETVDTGLNGAQGWYALGPVAGNASASVAIAGPFGEASATLKQPTGFYIMVQ